mgnify:CR=1 FL=1|jgi:hypothetical protein
MAIKYSINPQTFVNTHLSTTRNMVITGALAVTVSGLAIKNFTEHKLMSKLGLITSFSLILLSCYFGISSSYQLDIVLNKFEADKNLPQIYRELIPEWRKLGQMTMYYACFIFVIGIILLTSKVFAD